MSVTGQMLDEADERAGALSSALRRLVDAAEAMVSSEPDMPSHEATETEYDAAIDAARRALGQNTCRVCGPGPCVPSAHGMGPDWT